MNPHRILVAMFVIAVTLVTFREINVEQRMPLPRKYAAAAIVFFLLGVIDMMGASQLAATLAVGVVLAMAFVYFPAQGEGPLGHGAGILGGLGGAIGRVSGATPTPQRNATVEFKPL